MFFQILAQSVNPYAHRTLSQRKIRQAIGFGALVLLLVLFLASLFSIPLMLNLKNELSFELAKLELDFNGTVTTSVPVTFPQRNPLLAIDTTGTYVPKSSEVVIIKKDTLELGLPSSRQSIPLRAFKDTRAYRDTLVSFFFPLVLGALPAVFFYWYLAYAVKYLILVVVATLLGWLVCDLFISRISLRKLFITALHCVPAVIVPEVLLRPLLPQLIVYAPLKYGFSVPIVPLVLYALLFGLALFIIAKEERSYKSEELPW